MSLAGKKFTDLSTGDVVEVIDTFEDITILQGGQKVRTSRIMDSKFYQEYTDPQSLLGSSANAFAGIFEQLKSMPDEQISSIPNIDAKPNPAFNPATNESAVIGYTDPEVEKENLLKKYNMPSNTPSVNSNAFSKILDENNEEVQQVAQPRQQPQVPQQVDPVVQMFKSVKRINEIKIDLTITEKLPRPDFMEMWEDSYELSIIDYLADEFTNKLLQDPSKIKEIIREKIRDYVYPNKPKNQPRKGPVVKDGGTSRVKKSESIKEGKEKTNTKVVKTPKPKIKPAPQKNG